MGSVAIIGGGAFGTALACVLRRSGQEVVVWAREPEVAASIDAGRGNPRFLPGVDLQPGIRATADAALAVSEADFLLMAVPAQHMRAVAASLRPHLRPGMALVSCSKGVEEGSGALMPEVLADMLPDQVVAVLSGPSFAGEIARGQPCAVVLACGEWDVAEGIAARIDNRDFCVHLSADVPGVAVAGAMKNVISIASGIAFGRKLGENARATVVTLGLLESSRLGLVKGGKLQTFLGLAGAGDFMLTAQSLASRNTTLGIALGEGRRAAEVLGTRDAVTEGAHTVGAAAALAARLHVDMPITQALDAVLNHGVGIDAAIATLLTRLAPLRGAGWQ
jgi:glycerol-3-phosphate dehydrogenase (NAD(P)+)